MNTTEDLIASYKQAIQGRNWAQAVDAAQQLVNLHSSAEFLRMLAGAQLNTGTVEDSLATFDRALAASDTEKPVEGLSATEWKENRALIYVGRGNALLKLHRNTEAIDAYNHSGDLAANPAIAYFNVCAVLYNSGIVDDAATACRKSLQGDPARADAWFILGSALFSAAKMDAQGKLVLSTETRHALEEYLRLAPTGPHADDVKAMLQMAKEK